MKDQSKGKSRPKLVPFGDGHVQRNRRLVIPNVLLQNIGLQEGDAVEFFFDIGDTTGEKAIVVMKSKNPNRTKPRGRKRSGQRQEYIPSGSTEKS